MAIVFLGFPSILVEEPSPCAANLEPICSDFSFFDAEPNALVPAGGSGNPHFAVVSLLRMGASQNEGPWLFTSLDPSLS